MSQEAAIKTVTLAHLFRRMGGLGGAHILLTAINSLFALVMLLVLSRLLNSPRYAEIVFLTTITLYVQVLDQAIGRSNFVALRDVWLSGGRQPRPEVAATLLGHAGLLAAITLFAPLVLPAAGFQRYLENVLFLGFSLATNYWSFSLQSTAWAVDAAYRFVRIGLAQRLAHFAALGLLWATGDFLLFAAVSFGVSLAGQAIGLRLIWRTFPEISLVGAGVTKAGLAAQFERFRTALLSTFSELALFNSPYAVLILLFGLGPAMVTFDSIMKLGRLVLMGARTLAEVALPRYTRLMADADRSGAGKLSLIVLAACVLGGAAPALVLLFRGDLVFDLLLGANNVVPPQAGPVAAAILLGLAVYQPAMFLLGFAGAKSHVRIFTLYAVLGAAAFAGVVGLLRLGSIPTLWVYCGYLGGGALFAVFLATRLLKASPAAKSPGV